jgi:hypothetical protein
VSRTVLERIEQLMALATSPNEHEARNAALLAVQLMKKHKVMLTVPERKATPPATKRQTPQPAARRRSSPRGTKKMHDPPAKIVAPLGGECFHCGGRYRADQQIFWFDAKGGMHIKCFEEWASSTRR